MVSGEKTTPNGLTRRTAHLIRVCWHSCFKGTTVFEKTLDRLHTLNQYVFVGRAAAYPFFFTRKRFDEASRWVAADTMIDHDYQYACAVEPIKVGAIFENLIMDFRILEQIQGGMFILPSF